MSLCAACISGVRYEGTPTGEIIDINGVKVYRALPEKDYDKTKAVLFLTDVFGLSLENNRLLADDFARNGYQTYAPDYLNGDDVPPDALDPGSDFDLAAWLAKHGKEQTEPPLLAAIDGLKKQGITAFGATGYCFGGRYVFNLAYYGTTKVSVASHPSLLTEDDVTEYAKTTIPLLINSCEFDDQWLLLRSRL
ncbi:hypothetical protein VNI00_003499 [Paramarasmius palmivorus]|uniref:Dienelactone hydrolase domain-containing protein n=1 Tax=Paramarasmius palmivorus TaxID=297713 RepID=A0AAW0DTX0_9AGAR